MTAVIMHHNEKLFPDSEKFIPERWVERDGGTPSLERYLVSFGKGSRQCIGIKYVFPFNPSRYSTFVSYIDNCESLAKAEIYLTLATLFHRYQNMTLFDTNFERDVKLTHDMLLPQPSKASRGMRVIFK